MKTVFLRDNLDEMPNTIFWKKKQQKTKKNILNLSIAEFAQSGKG